MPVESVNNLNINQIENTEIQTSKDVENTFTKPYPNDSVEISTKKPKSKKKLWKNIAIGFGGTMATIVTAVILFAKHQNNKISKLYKDKLVISNLAEKIDFKEAKTLEEAVKFTKETLGIKEIDKDLTLEALNVANRGLTDVSNANKGKVFMPRALRFDVPTEGETTYVAYVDSNIESKTFGNLVMNKNYFDNSYMDKKLKEDLYDKDGKEIFSFASMTEASSTRYYIAGAYVFPDKDLAKLVNKFYKNPESLNIAEKQKIYYSFSKGDNILTRKLRVPMEALTEIKEKNKDFLRENGIKIDIEELSKQTTKKQKEFLENIFDKMLEKKKCKHEFYGIKLPTSTIHHEMGHLQDFAKNLKELDLKSWEIGTKKFWQELWHNAKKKDNRSGVDEVENRWGSIIHKSYKNLFNENTEKFKKYYPEWHEFLTNQEIQQTAGKVSGYAQSGIGEFIAETYVRMIAKEKLPEDVLALYKKYNGPTLAA